ncbi:hypothetical protein C3Z09_01530 [Lelliottia aquatilis]|nr:hypothetical protein C3Z09_01530 [Lelliottia aquatilis]
MSPNMMLACTRPLQFQQGPFFRLHISPGGGFALPGLQNRRTVQAKRRRANHGLVAINTARIGAG